MARRAGSCLGGVKTLASRRPCADPRVVLDASQSSASAARKWGWAALAVSRRGRATWWRIPQAPSATSPPRAHWALSMCRGSCMEQQARRQPGAVAARVPGRVQREGRPGAMRAYGLPALGPLGCSPPARAPAWHTPSMVWQPLPYLGVCGSTAGVVCAIPFPASGAQQADDGRCGCRGPGEGWGHGRLTWLGASESA